VGKTKNTENNGIVIFMDLTGEDSFKFISIPGCEVTEIDLILTLM
jgi:hypothetical protein